MFDAQFDDAKKRATPKEAARFISNRAVWAAPRQKV